MPYETAALAQFKKNIEQYTDALITHIIHFKLTETAHANYWLQLVEQNLALSAEIAQQIAHQKKQDASYAPFTPFESIQAMLTTETKPISNPEQAANAAFNHFEYQAHETKAKQVRIEKRFTQAAYTGPTQHDFRERLAIIYETAKKRVTDDADKLWQLNQLRAKAERIIEQYQIHPIPLAQLSTPAREKALCKTIKKAQRCIGAFIHDIAPIIQTPTETKAQCMKHLAQEESEYTASKGRPNFINYYAMPGFRGHNATVERVSIQRVVGHAIPSTERAQAKLPNFVECSVGYKTSEHSGYVEQFRGYRHSAYPPIGISNQFKRRQATAVIVREMLTELAKQQLLKSPQSAPIRLNLSSLALLSPIQGDKVYMGAASEYRQLTESYHALMMYHGREITLSIDGQNIRVKPNITLINAPSNYLGIQFNQKLPMTMQHGSSITLQGMLKFIQKTDRLRQAKHRFMTGSMREHLRQIERERRALQKQYAYVEKCLNDGDEQQYKKAFDALTRANAKIFKLEAQLRQKIKKRYHAIRKTGYDGATRETKQDIELLSFQAIAMYLDGKVEPNQFGVRYMMASQKMGDAVDFYCKSGEDRTGRVQNFVEELSAFYEQFGRYPCYDFDKKALDPEDRKRQMQIAKVVSEYSTSRDTNNQNAHGARGLQITGDLQLNQGLPNQSGDALGKMAKGVYQDAKTGHSLSEYLVPDETHAPQANEAELRALVGDTGIESGCLRAKNAMSKLLRDDKVKSGQLHDLIEQMQQAESLEDKLKHFIDFVLVAKQQRSWLENVFQIERPTKTLMCLRKQVNQPLNQLITAIVQSKYDGHNDAMKSKLIADWVNQSEKHPNPTEDADSPTAPLLPKNNRGC